MMKQVDVVIVGAGIVGLSLAVLLGEQKLNVVVLDAKKYSEPKLGEHARASAINLASQRILSNLGVWQLLPKEHPSAFQAIKVWDVQGKGKIEFDSTECAEPYLGHIIPNHLLQEALFKRLDQLNSVKLICPVDIQDIQVKDDSVTISLPQGNLVAKLLVGADGANSWIRKYFEFETLSSPYDQTAIITTVETTLSHARTARQCFLPTGPLAFLPLKNLHHSSIVWTTTLQESEELLSLNESDFLEKLSSAFEYKLGKVTQRLDTPKRFPLIMQHAKNYVKARVALVGDACHSIHPLAGQGLNMGIMDVACLGEIIIEVSENARDIGLVNHLRRYERWRKGDNWMMIGAMAGFKQLFGMDSEIMIDIRSAGLNIVNNISLLKKHFMRYAMGDRIKLPAIAK